MKRGSSIAKVAAQVALILSLTAVSMLAQAPSSIQIFMPGGALPARSMRFTLTRDDGRIETLFTDTKGKFLITGDLVREAEYTITVESDGQSFGTTVTTFRILRNQVVYLPIFLNPFSEKVRKRPGVLDVTDANVPAEARNAYQQAMQKVAEGKAENAVSDFQHALSLHPRYLRALNDLGVLYLKLNRLDESASTFRQALKIDHNSLYPLLNLGIVLNRQGNHAEAAELLGKLYRNNSEFTAANVPYGEALAETGQLAEAEKVLRQLTCFCQSFSVGYVGCRELERAITLEPDTVMAHLQLGGALIQLKRLPEAERELLRAYELGGRSAGGAQFLLGQVYHLELKYEPALHAFEQYLIDLPSAPNAAQVREAIEMLKAVLKQK